MHILPTNHRYALLAPVLALIALLLPLALAGQPTSHSPQQAVERAWGLAQDSGAYSFHTSIDQQTNAVPSLRSAGRPARHDYLSLQGAIDQPAERMELAMWRTLGPQPPNVMQIRVADGQTLGRAGTGEWQPTEVDTASFAPGGDPLGFLAAATNVQVGASETRDFGEVSRAYSSYTFAIDGQTFASYLEQKLVPQLREQGKLPTWLTPDFQAQYKDMHGTGALWIDQDGLPARLELAVQLPGAKNAGSVQANLTTDYSGFNLERLALASTRFSDNPTGWLGYRLGELRASASSLHGVAANMLVVLGLLALMVLSFPYWRNRWFYRYLVLLVIGSMLLSPLLQAREVAAYSDEQQAAQAQQEVDAQRADAQQNALATLQQPSMQPHQAPSASLLSDTAPAAAATALSAPTASVQASANAAPAASVSATDTDGDGLSDVDEAELDSCPSQTDTSPLCDNVADSTDTDGDGLSDGVEAHSIGTLPTNDDSDGDSIADPLEVKGFSYNGKTWYLNPSETDTNKDGLIDSLECPVWLVASDDYNPAGICPDTDADGTPDVWDDDNDNDSVRDTNDLDPLKIQTGYSDAAPLKLAINSLATNEPVMVDVQLRPTEVAHLNYINSVLDWPTGDTDGQIQRRNTTTWATTANSELQNSSANAANGDIRLTPMLEITIPYSAGSYANLPVKTAYKNTSRTLGLTVDQWLDTTELDPYSITVRDADSTSGDLVLYVPLSEVTDSTSGLREAFSARMLYWPSQNSWGSAHEYRVLWMVEMLTDECIDPTADEDSCARQDSYQLLNTYTENWDLTGLSVREDHGLAVNILYEDPAQEAVADRDEEDDLWAALWNLNNTWLRGRNCDVMVNNVCQSNGGRDVTIANMEATLDTWSGNTDAIEAVTRNYAHKDYIASVLMTDTTTLLRTKFTGVVDETSLLFAREETYREGGLGTATIAGTAVTVSMSANDAPLTVSAFMGWSRYQYVNGVWDNYDDEEDLTRLAADLATQSYFQASDPNDSDSVDEAAGKIIMSQFYYSTMLDGVAAIIETDGQSTWASEEGYGAIPETGYAPSWPATTFTGAAYASFEFLTILNPSTSKFGGSFFQRVSAAMRNPATTVFTKELLGSKVSQGLMFSMFASTAFGLGLFAVGYFTGDAELLNVATIILNATTLVATVAWSANIITGYVRVAAAGAGAGFGTSWSLMKQISSANRAVGVSGLALSLVLGVGVFLMTGITSGLFAHGSYIEVSAATAQVIATAIVALILFAIDLIPIAGPIIVGLIYLIDTIIALVCECMGIQQHLAAVITDVLFDIDSPITNFDSDDRFDMNIDTAYTNADGGFTTANGIIFSVDMTNTLKYESAGWFDELEAAFKLSRTAIAFNNAKKTTVIENLMTASRMQAQLGGSVGLNSMEDDWDSIGGHKMRNSTQHEVTVPFSRLGIGINRSMDGKLYLYERYAIPYRGCWVGWLGMSRTCGSWKSTTDMSSTNLGKYYSFDILPATLTAFYKMDWANNGSLPFPTNIDFDNDGLANTIDPNDKDDDTDNDGVSDYTELTEGTDPKVTDSDHDGLTDAQELQRGMDPLDDDSDDDGLTDKEEWDGWKFYYVQNGVRKFTWVWSDPSYADTDGDSFDDQQEYNFGFNPTIVNSIDELLSTITFADSTVSERKVPQLLMRFEERAGAQSFADFSGSSRTASCDLSNAACPTAGVTGRYGGSLVFDGANDVITLDNESAYDLNGMSISVWAKIDAFTKPWQAIVSKGGAWGLYRYADTNYVTFQTQGTTNNDTYWTTAVADGKWHHYAVTYDGSMKYFYLDGSMIRGTTTRGTVTSNNNPVLIGGDSAVAGREFKGAIDDLAIFNYAIDSTQRLNLMNGKYTSADNLMLPGDTFDTSLTIANSNANYPAAVTYYAESDELTTDVTPHKHWKFENSNSGNNPTRIYQETAGVGTYGECSGTTCPTFGVAGHSNLGIQLDEGDSIDMKFATYGSTFSKSVAYGAWVYPTGGGAYKTQRVLTYRRSNTGDIASLADAIYYDRDTQKFSSSYTTEKTSVVAPLNQWSHIMLVYDRVSNAQHLYLNGQLIATGIVPVASAYEAGIKYLHIGDPITTNDLDNNQVIGFIGKVDDMKMYSDRVLTEADIQQIMNNQTPTTAVIADYTQVNIPLASQATIADAFNIAASAASGAKSYSQVAEAALDITDELGFTAQPVVRAHFDELFSKKVYSSLPPYYQTTTCSGCQYVNDFAGGAIEFTGFYPSGYLQVPVPLTSPAWSIGIWFRPDTAASGSKRGIFGRWNGGGGFPSLYLLNDGKLSLSLYTTGSGWKDYTPSGATTVSTGHWHQATVTFDGTSSYQIYLDGQAYGGTIAAGVARTDSPVYLGSAYNYNQFDGRIDNFTVYNTKLSAAEVQSLASISDLSLHAQYTFDGRPGDTTFTDQAGIFGDATCTSCPASGFRGQVNRAAYFDGNDLLTSANKPGYWQLSQRDYTVAAWVKVQQGSIIEAAGFYQPFALWSNRISGGYSGTANASGHAFYEDSAAFVQQPGDQWMHIVAVHTDENITNTSRDGIYINGVKVDSTRWLSSNISSVNKQLSIGGKLVGYLDDLRIYNRVLSTSDITSLYTTTRPVMQYEFEETYGATSFADSSAYGYDGAAVGVTPGEGGRVGNAATFDGASYIKATGATTADGMAASTTVMAWVKPSSISGTQAIIATSSSSANKGMRLQIVDGKLMLTNGAAWVSSSTTLAVDTWAHVAAVLDQSTKVTFYVNGVYAGSGTLTSSPQADTDGIVTIGARTANGGTSYQDFFTGKIDELYVYQRSLNALEVRSTYNEQFYWFRDQRTWSVMIDADAPTIDILNTQTQWTDDEVQIVVSTADATSSIWAFDYKLVTPSGTLTGQTAQECADSTNHNLWCVVINPSMLGGDGAYTFTFRAVDTVGHEAYSPSQTIYVDGTAPTITAAYSNTWVTPTADANESETWHVALSGTISDPAVHSVAGTGVATETVLVSLLDATGTVLGSGPLLATVSGNAWSVDYELSGLAPTGRYSVQVAGADKLGNSSTKQGTVLVDVTAPASRFNTTVLPESIMDQTTLNGVVTDMAALPDELAGFRFAESVGATSFSGSGDGGMIATCSSCPTSATGAIGKGLLFDGAANKLTRAVPTTETLALDVATFSAWVKPTWAAGSGGSRTILAMSDGSGTRYSWQLNANYTAMELNNGSTTLHVPVSLAANQWYHLALVQDNSSWTGYVDGAAVGTVAQTFGSATGLPLQIGSTGSSGFFQGMLDEVSIYGRALTAGEIYTLAQDEIAGVTSVEVGLQPYVFDSPTTTDEGTVWHAATLSQSNTGQTAWSYALPTNMEGFYQVRLRTTDARGNREDHGVYWRGPIDNRAPRVTNSFKKIGGKYTAYLEYTLDIDEAFFNLDEVVHPCISATSKQQTLTYNEQLGLLTHAHIVCQVPIPLPATPQTYSYSLTVADLLGHTISRSQSFTTVSNDLNEVALLSPIAGAVVTGTNALTITGVAYSNAMVKTITVKVDGVQVASLPFQNIEDVDWSTVWTPESPGMHTISIVMLDNFNRTYTDSATIEVKSDLAPGGVRADLGLWLQADIGIAASAEGAAVATWRDQMEGWDARRTTGLTPTLNLDAINFNPAVTFGSAGASELSFGSNYVTAGPGSTGMTILAVVDPSSMGGTGHLAVDAGQYNSNGYGLAYSANNISGYSPESDAGGNGLAVDNTPADDRPTVVAYKIDFDASSGSLAVNGNVVNVGSTGPLTRIDAANLVLSASHAAESGPLTIGRQAKENDKADRYFRGDIAEVIIYKGALSDAQRRQVESYLAIKYGITLGGADYSSSTGTVVWDAQAQSDFHHNVAGIGRDDGSNMQQRKSHSINEQGYLTIANGSTFSAPSAFETDQSFLVWGDDNGSLTTTTPVTSSTLTYERLDRTWQAKETGGMGDVQLAFDTSFLSDISPLPFLLVDNDRNFSSPRLVAGTLVGSQAVYGVDLADGEYFTLAINAADRLRLVLPGNGSGTVSSIPAGVSCSATCDTTLDYRSTYVLTTTLATGSLFTGWSGACSGVLTCTVTIDHLGPVTATFTLKQYPLNITMTGSGSGLISDSSTGVHCRISCAPLLNHGTLVNLTATPRLSSTFVGWGGACSGTGTCTVTLTEARLVTATFSNPDGAPYSGEAWPIPGTIQAEDYNIGGQDVAYHDSESRNRGGGYRTNEWVDAFGTDDGSPAVGYTNVGEWLKYTVYVSETGVYGINMRAANPSSGVLITLKVDGVTVSDQIAVGNSGSHYVYQTTSTSGISLTAGEHVLTLLFEPKSPGNINWFSFTRQDTLTVGLTSGGSGTVASSPAGISCGSDCSESYDLGTTVALMPTAQVGSSFAGWSGACSGTAACTVAINASKSVTATFTHNLYTLDVAKTGDGAGSISGDGIDCGADCSETLPYSTVVTLTATASTGTFTGWGGACSGSDDCVVTIDELNHVTATFENKYRVTVATDGSGEGTVTNPAGIACGAGSIECSRLFQVGESVTLTALPSESSDFAGWSGACSGTGECTVTVDGARSVTATFTLKQYSLTLTISGNGQGAVSSTPAVIDCGVGGVGGSDCSEQLDHGSLVTLVTNVEPGSGFGGWSGACSGTGDCTVTMGGITEVSAEIYNCLDFTVTNGNDSGSGTLRQAIERACSGAVIGFDGDYTVALDSDKLTIDSGMTIDGGTHAITVTAEAVGLNYFDGGVFKIDGSEPVTLTNLIITGGTAWAGGGVKNNGNLTIIGSTITGNQAFGPTDFGGGIYNSGTLNLTNSLVDQNGSASYGGGIYSGPGSRMTISESTVSNNSTPNDGGGLMVREDAVVTIEDSTFRGNSARDGGGIATYGAVTISGSTFEQNSTHGQNTTFWNTSDGGGVNVFGGGSANISGTTFSGNIGNVNGGGVNVDGGSVTIEDSIFTGNTAQRGAGVTARADTTISGSSFAQNHTSTSGSGVYGTGSTVTINDTDFISNTTETYGGAIDASFATFNISNSDFISNTADYQAGAIYKCGGSMQLTGSSVLSNTVTPSGSANGGGIYDYCGGSLTIDDSEFMGNSASYGGALASNDSTVTVSDSRFSHNSVQGGLDVNPDACYEDCYFHSEERCDNNCTFIPSEDCEDERCQGEDTWYCATNCAPAPAPDSRGGAIYSSSNMTIRNSTIISNSSDMDGGGVGVGWDSTTIIDSTISGNHAEQGGGVSVKWGNATISNSTISDNQGGGVYSAGESIITLGNATISDNQGGGVYSAGELNMQNTIIANSVGGGDCVSDGSMATNTSNLVEDGTCSPALSGDPQLAPLGDYGGATQTQALLPGSPAIDAGDNATCITTDQRGQARPSGASCDIGAVESQGFYLSIVTGDDQVAGIDTPVPAPLAVALMLSGSDKPVGAGHVITFSAPASGPGLTTTTFTATTDLSGVASAQPTANGTIGLYGVTASTANVDGTVTFNLENAAPYQLNVGITGSGTVSSGTGSINCTSSCSKVFGQSSALNLVATPAPGWTFMGWGGDCSGTGSCALTITAATSVTATFSDLDAPAPPVLTGMSDDTGTLGDRLTNDQTLIVNGRAEAGSTVTLTRVGTGVLGTATASAGGSWSFDYRGTSLPEGDVGFTAITTDPEHNSSAASAIFTVTVDLTAPTAPAITGISMDSDTPGDRITTDETLVLSGSAVAGSKVTITRAGTGVIGTTIARASGLWTFDYSAVALPEGATSFSATATDTAGNVSAISATFTVTVHQTAPDAPQIKRITDDYGTQGDEITNDSMIQIYGSAEPNSTVKLTRVGTGVIGSPKADANGSWMVPYGDVVLPDGQHYFTATATDLAGKTSVASATFTVTVDTSIGAPTIDSMSDDTGAAGDRVTSDRTLTLNGSAEPNSTVRITREGDTIGNASVDANGNWSFDDTTQLPEGAATYAAFASDLANNTSGESDQFVVTIDLAAPSAPVFTGMSDDSAPVGDEITTDQTLVLSGTAEADSTITLNRKDLGEIGTALADASGNWSFDYSGTSLPGGDTSFTAKATDSSGNTSAASAAFIVTVVKTHADPPMITGISDDTGTVGDGITHDQTLFLNGTTEAYSSITITRTGTGEIGSVTANVSGNWSFDYSGTSLPEGDTSFTANATDTVGNVSAESAVFTVTVDLTAPTIPAITSFSDDTGTVGDHITLDATLMLSGTATTSDTVTLTRADAGVIGSAMAGADGHWSFDYSSVTLPYGTAVFTATATDLAGNSSAASPTFTVTVRAPVTWYVNDDASGADSGANWTDAFTDLQSALGVADEGDQIWVAAGSYAPGAAGNRDATFVLKDGVALYGGFAGSETLLGQRNWFTHVVTLSGDLLGNDGPNFANSGENSYHVVTGAAGATLDGVTISGGNANGSGPASSGGGMLSTSGNPTLTNVSFSGNRAVGEGGGMYASSASPALTNVTFSGNTAANGGGLSTASGNPALTNVIFSGNSASGKGGGIYTNGGSPTLTNVTISGNQAANGGGMYNDSSSPQIRNSIIWGNRAGAAASAIANASSSPSVSTSIVEGGHSGSGNLNVDPQFVSAVPTAPSDGGDLRLQASSPAIDAGDNAAIIPSLGATDRDGNPRIANSTVDLGAYEYVVAGGQVNQPPTLDPPADLTILEDAGAQTVSLAGIGAGGGASQALGVTATSSNPALIAASTVTYASPNASGSLSFTPAPNANGDVTITLTVTDDGGTANGGSNSVLRSFKVRIKPVNDAPSFTAGPNQTVGALAGAQSVAGWASKFAPGAGDEASQTLLGYSIASNTTPSLFSVAPAIDASGKLTYTPKPGAGGTATISVRVRDSGGTANGGVDTSVVRTFTITVKPGYQTFLPLVLRG